jgi:hypothetical protein
VWRGLVSRHTGPYLGAMRRQLISVVCLAAALLIGIVAIVDHRNKQARINRADVGEWYCRHDGTRCGGPSSERIEAHWNERQWGYEIAVSALGGFAIVRLVYRLART